MALSREGTCAYAGDTASFEDSSLHSDKEWRILHQKDFSSNLDFLHHLDQSFLGKSHIRCEADESCFCSHLVNIQVWVTADRNGHWEPLWQLGKAPPLSSVGLEVTTALGEAASSFLSTYEEKPTLLQKNVKQWYLATPCPDHSSFPADVVD